VRTSSRDTSAARRRPGNGCSPRNDPVA
jgi:hypothetical protein